MSSNSSLIEDLEILCSWILEEANKNLKSTISLDYSNGSVSLEDVVQVDTCIHLLQSEDVNNNEPCSVTIKLPESYPYFISRVVIVSEARIIELFGKCEEYITTSTAEYIDDFENCAVYMANCALKPVNQLIIKFQRTKHPNSLWLYGIKIKLHSKTPNVQTLSGIDYQTVNEILREAKVPISENAEKCKAFLQNYRGALDKNPHLFGRKPPDSQLFMKMLQSNYFNSFDEKWKQESKTNFFPSLLGDSIEKRTMFQSGESKGAGQSEMSMLKNYIDNRLSELEKRVEEFEQKIIELDKQQQAKLDCIIELLRK